MTSKTRLIGNIVAFALLIILMIAGCKGPSNRASATRDAKTKCVDSAKQWVEFEQGFFACVGAG